MYSSRLYSRKEKKKKKKKQSNQNSKISGINLHS